MAQEQWQWSPSEPPAAMCAGAGVETDGQCLAAQHHRKTTGRRIKYELGMRVQYPGVSSSGGVNCGRPLAGSSASLVELTTPVVLPRPPEQLDCLLCALRMSDQGLVLSQLPAGVWTLRHLQSLDLSRNKLEGLPDGLAGMTGLTSLDLSRNRLRVVPDVLVPLLASGSMISLSLQANKLHPLPRGIPPRLLAAFSDIGSPLAMLNLQFNQKLRKDCSKLSAMLGPAIVDLRLPGGVASSGGPPVKKETYGDRDATLLRSQLEPLSTPTLRARLAYCFDLPTAPESSDREQVMRLLLAAYAAKGPAGRVLRPVAGLAMRSELACDLLACLRGMDWRNLPKERPSVRAEGYMILHRPTTEGELRPEMHVDHHQQKSTPGPEARAKEATAEPEPEPEPESRPTRLSNKELRRQRAIARRQQRQERLLSGGGVTPASHSLKSDPEQASAAKRAQAAKLAQHTVLWALARTAIEEADLQYAARYSAIAVSKCFVGSPHVDGYDLAPQFALSLGNFDGGQLCVECNPQEVAVRPADIMPRMTCTCHPSI
jgi:Leucine-rich repeat (LRR) protein